MKNILSSGKVSDDDLRRILVTLRTFLVKKVNKTRSRTILALYQVDTGSRAFERGVVYILPTLNRNLSLL